MGFKPKCGDGVRDSLFEGTLDSEALGQAVHPILDPGIPKPSSVNFQKRVEDRLWSQVSGVPFAVPAIPRLRQEDCCRKILRNGGERRLPVAQDSLFASLLFCTLSHNPRPRKAAFGGPWCDARMWGAQG